MVMLASTALTMRFHGTLSKNWRGRGSMARATQSERAGISLDRLDSLLIAGLRGVVRLS